MKNPRRTILGLMFFVAVFNTIDKFVDDDPETLPRPRTFLAPLLAAVFLSMLSTVTSRVAVGLAVIVFVTTLTTIGPDTLGKIQPDALAAVARTARRSSGGRTIEPKPTSEPNTNRNDSTSNRSTFGS